MTATHAVGTYGNAVGTVTPLDHKMAQLGLIVKTAANTIRAGIFWDGNATIVSGKANMSYDVRALTAVLSRGATSGAVLLSNDAVFNVVTTAAPGSNSRYDVVYLWQREYSLDGTDSNPVIGVVQGTPAASPTVPSLAAFPGAISLAQILVPAGVTATNSGTTITQTALFTATSGSLIPFRNTTERDAGSYVEGQLGWLLDSHTIQKYSGTGWAGLASSQTIIPTIVASGGTSAVATDGTITASGAVASLRWNADKTLMSAFRRVNVTIDYEASVTALHSTRLADGASIQSTAATYLGQGALVATGTVSAYNPSAGSNWNDISNAQRKSHRLRYSIAALAVASETAVQVTGSAYDASQANLIEILGAHQGHTQLAAYDGMEFTFTYASGSMTALTIRITGEV